MNEGRITRRRFLALCGISGAAVAAAGAARLLLQGHHERLTDEVAAIFSDRGAAEAVGRAYLDSRRDEDDERKLIRLLESSDSRWSRPLKARRLHALARSGARSDFAAGRTVAVEGWIVSVTEARLCALATLA